MKKYHIITFGCQMNKSDSERISTIIEEMGYIETSNIKEANLVVINMCSVRQSAVDRVYGLIPQLRRAKVKTILTGCFLESDRRKLEESFTVVKKKDLTKKNFLKIVPKYSNKIQAFVPISNGCNNFCTYCAVPYTRGRLISRNYNDILKEIKSLVKKGYKEIWLLGENVNQYEYKGIDFSDLMKKVNEIEGDFWVKFTSPNPKDFSQKMINTFSKSNKFSPYLNLPLQSGDDDILRKMNRSYTVKHYLELIKKIRKAFKGNISISTDIIVGFPTETKNQFNNTKKVFKSVGFDMAYISQFSPRPQSYCYKEMKDNILKKDKREREFELNEILKKSALKNNKKLLGKVVDVLVLEKDNGRTKDNKAIRFNSDKVGEFIKVKVKKISPWSLEGETVKPKLVVILGPTASGKTNLAIKLVKKFNGEIVSADSRQIYKGMDIGTAKPKDFPHKMIDIVNPKEDFNVAIYKEMAVKEIENIIKKGKVPFLVGGTGLYIKSIVDNYAFPKLESDKGLRDKLEKKTIEQLFLMYQKLDKEGSKRIDKKNKRRLIRAIEVSLNLKDGFFKERKDEPMYDVLQIGIKSKDINEKIEKRVKSMIKDGLEAEAKKINKKYGETNTIGYQEWNSPNPKESIILNTIKFSKRQMTWFKKDKRIKWISNYSEAKDKISKFLI
ncbi:MAG: tRNA (adenosine(37)-N6)-dimethylallyltransferase MiaA [Candidatus Paceibacterota bacterium]